MATYASMLRAVNVGGRTMPMSSLRTVYESLGFDQIQTYIQSGNVVFQTTQRAAGLAKSIEAAITDEFGIDVTVIIRTAMELARIVEANPFVKPTVDTKGLHVAFLRDKPSATKVDTIDRVKFEANAFEVIGREIYMYYPNGYGQTKMNAGFFERALGTRATARNWNTVRKLREMTS